MAKENTVLLYGYMETTPTIHFQGNEIDYVRFSLVTTRRTYSNNLILTGPEREDKITVFVRNKELIQKIWDYKNQSDEEEPFLDTMIFLRGSLCTKYITRILRCPDCHEAYKKDYFLTYVDPIDLYFWEHPVDNQASLVHEKFELSNLIFIWGTLVRNPDIFPSMYEIGLSRQNNEKLSKIECEFQIASNRKRKILEDTPMDTTDYPWVKVFGQKAIEAYETLETGTEIYIHGSLEARNVDNSNICPHCGHVSITHDTVMEIVPYTIMKDDMENTAFLYGKIYKNPKMHLNDEGDIDMISFPLLTVRKTFDSRLHVFKKNRYDIPTVTITNPFLIKQFLAYSAKRKKNPDFNILNTVLLIKGVVQTVDKTISMQCPFCGQEFEKTGSRAYVNAVGFYVWGENVDHDTALDLLDEHHEISNLVFLHGILCSPPDLYPNSSLFIHPSKRLCEFQMESQKTRVPLYGADKVASLFPWVRVYGARALDAYEALQTDSEVFIYGSIESTKSLSYNTCPSCNRVFVQEEIISEIVPYSIEYGDNCMKPEGVHGGSLDESVFEEEDDVNESFTE